MLAIIIFTVFAIVVIFGVVDLKKSKLSPQHKVLILTAVGVLLSVSLLISALKQTRHLTFSLLKSNMNQVERRFTEIPNYKYKYDLQVSQPFNEVYYLSNYPLYNDIVLNRRQKIIYVSRKNEGASTFLFHLTKKLQQKRIPTFFIKIQSEIFDQIDALEAFNIPSIKTLEDVVETWNLKGSIPYLIIDGVEYLTNCQSILSNLANIFKKFDLNFIGNTENKRALQRFFTIIPYQSITVRQWTAPSYTILQKVSPNSYFKRLPNNFHTLSQIQSSSQQQILMRSSSHNKDLVNQLGIGQVLKQINGKQVSVSFLKNIITADQLNNAINSGILKVSNGIVSTTGHFGK